MSEVELHITVSGVGKAADVAKLIDTAMAMRDPETQTVIPAGYHCIECNASDGRHQVDCSFYHIQGPE